MKPFLGIDLTENKKNLQMNGQEFLIAKPSSALNDALERSKENIDETFEKSKLPLPIRIGQYICGVVGALVAIGILKALGDEDGISLAQAYQNAAWLFYLAGACLIIWVVLKFWGSRKEKNTFEAEESTQVFEHWEDTSDAIFSELSVPSTAKDVDILSFFYKVKGDKIKPCEKGLQFTPYISNVFCAFSDSDNLYFANLEGKYAFPLSCIKAIKTVKKSICTDMWNKDEPYNKGVYKQFKLDVTNFGGIICKSYHIIEIEQNGQLWGIYIPSYELPVLEELTQLKAETE